MAEASAQRVCVIGAGPSGIAAAKALHQRGIDVECFERRTRVGGLWAVAHGEVQASYPSLECNTSKRRTEFSDFPMPQAFPPYPHNTQMAAYFDAYVDHFGFRHLITFNTSVEHAARAADGTWEVHLSTGETRRFDALVVANGHHRRYTRSRAVAALESAGFEVRRATYGFAAVFPLFAVERLVRAFRHRLSRGRGAGPADVVDVPEIGPLVERLLLRLCRWDARMLAHRDLPFGSSVFLAAVKPV
jgi:2-polyprenyl-6-methoxyphenol hydroxylase-like FAD-dependent oxidoreductase